MVFPSRLVYVFVASPARRTRLAALGHQNNLPLSIAIFNPIQSVTGIINVRIKADATFEKVVATHPTQPIVAAVAYDSVVQIVACS